MMDLGKDMKTFLRGVINGQHSVAFLIVLVLLSLQAVKACRSIEYVLMGQDVNQVHLTELFIKNDIPSIDDGEVGENLRYLVLSNLNFLVPLIGAKVNLNPLYYIAIQMLVISPLLFWGIYLCANALFNNKHLSAFTGLLFFYNDFWLFKINIGCPIMLNNFYYYSDIGHVAAVFFLFFMAKGKYSKAALCAAIGILINPIYGLNLALLMVIGLFVSGRMRNLSREDYLSFGAIVLATLSAWGFIKLATPIYNPAPLEARIIAILTNGHMALQAYGPLKYFVAIVLLLGATTFVVMLERVRRFSSHDQKMPSFESSVLALSMLIFLSVQGIVGYWILYVFFPTLFPVFGPYKTLMIVAIYLAVYIAYAIYVVFLRTRKMALFFFAPFILILLTGRYPALPYAAWVGIVVLLGLCIWIVKHKSERSLFSASNFGLSLAILLLLCDAAYSSAKPFFDKRIRVARALYDISSDISRQTDPKAVFAPYRLAGTHVNKHGPYASMAFRTFSRRAFLSYYCIGRNVYYNSLLRHKNEERAFTAAGLVCWTELENAAKRMRKEDPLAYYAGVSLRPSFRFLGSTTLNKVYNDKINQLNDFTSGLNFNEYMAYAKKLGATHVIVSHDKNAIVPAKPLIYNEYFSVYKIE